MQLLNISDQTCSIKSSVYLWNDSICSAHGISLSSLISSNNTHSSPFYVHRTVTPPPDVLNATWAKWKCEIFAKGILQVDDYSDVQHRSCTPTATTAAKDCCFKAALSQNRKSLGLSPAAAVLCMKPEICKHREAVLVWAILQLFAIVFHRVFMFFLSGGRGRWLFQTSLPGSCSIKKKKK